MTMKLDRTKLVKKLGSRSKLAWRIDRALEEGEFEGVMNFDFSPKEQDDAWHPSGHCTPSLAELYEYAVHGKEEKFPASLRKTFMVGHFWHAYLQHVVVERLGFATWEDVERRHEVRWTEGPWGWARGSADIAPCRIPEFGDVLVDFKTTNTFSYNADKFPLDKWECQGAIYMDWHNLDHAIFMAVMKDSPHEMKEIVFERNPALVDAIYEKWALVGEFIKAGIQPPAEEPFHLPLAGPITL